MYYTVCLQDPQRHGSILKSLAFCCKTSTLIPTEWYREEERGQALLFSTHPTPNTAQTRQRRALTVCKDLNQFFSWSHLVVTGDSNVNISQWRVSVAQSDGRDVDVGSLSQWLMVSTRVCHNQETGLAESCLDLIGECTGGEPTVEGGGASGRGELQHCPL